MPVWTEKWLQPYTDETLEALPGRHQKVLGCACFSVDCLETLEEINMKGAKFPEAGGEEFDYIPCLNDNPHIDLIRTMCMKGVEAFR